MNRFSRAKLESGNEVDLKHGCGISFDYRRLSLCPPSEEMLGIVACF